MYFKVACPPCLLRKRSYLVDGVLALEKKKKKTFQKRCSFQRMKTGESLIPVSKDMHRKK